MTRARARARAWLAARTRAALALGTIAALASLLPAMGCADGALQRCRDMKGALVSEQQALRSRLAAQKVALAQLAAERAKLVAERDALQKRFASAPAVGPSKAARQVELTVMLRPGGAVTLEGRPVAWSALGQALVGHHKRTPDARVTIAADVKVKHKRVAAVLDMVKAAGFSRVGFRIRRK